MSIPVVRIARKRSTDVSPELLNKFTALVEALDDESVAHAIDTIADERLCRRRRLADWFYELEENMPPPYYLELWTKNDDDTWSLFSRRLVERHW